MAHIVIEYESTRIETWDNTSIRDSGLQQDKCCDLAICGECLNRLCCTQPANLVYSSYISRTEILFEDRCRQRNVPWRWIFLGGQLL